AEDGIRDFHVTGVQTCALPICEVFGAQALRDTQTVRGAVPGWRAVRFDEPLRQRRLPATRTHEEIRDRDPQDRSREARYDGSLRCGEETAGRNLRWYA